MTTSLTDATQVEFDKYCSILLHLGLIRRVVTSEGTRCELTDSGSMFLKEYQGAQLERVPNHKMDTRETYVSLAKAHVTVVIPTLNEAEGIANVIHEVEEEGYRNVWALPGGRVGKGERLQAAAEGILGEYGLAARDLFLVGVFPIRFPSRFDLSVCLAAKHSTGEARPDGVEFSNFRLICEASCLRQCA